MTFVLSPQLDSGANPNLHWELYRSYLKNNKNEIPKSVFETLDHEHWEGGSNTFSPYMSNLTSIEITNIGTKDSKCILVLEKSGYIEKPIEIIVVYSGLLKVDLPDIGGLTEGFTKTWRYNQFLVFDAWPDYEKKGAYFTHQIEFVGNYVYSITASNIQVAWNVT